VSKPAPVPPYGSSVPPPVPVLPSGRAVPNDAITLCLLDGSTVPIDVAEFDHLARVLDDNDPSVRVTNLGTKRREWIRASAIIRVILPADHPSAD
jgi:hypothetical protein